MKRMTFELCMPANCERLQALLLPSFDHSRFPPSPARAPLFHLCQHASLTSHSTRLHFSPALVCVPLSIMVPPLLLASPTHRPVPGSAHPLLLRARASTHLSLARCAPPLVPCQRDGPSPPRARLFPILRSSASPIHPPARLLSPSA